MKLTTKVWERLPRTMSAEARSRWVEGRREYVGCSEIAAAMGLSAYRSRYDLWAEKRHGVRSFAGNTLTRRGQALERWIFGEWQNFTGLYAYKPRRVFGVEECPRLRGNLDGWCPSTREPVEVKDTSWRMRDDWQALRDRGELRPGTSVFTYWLQIQGQMAITGARSGWFAVAIDRDVDCFRVERDDEAIAKILRAVDDFWRLVESPLESPPMKPEDMQTAELVIGTPTKEVIELSGDRAEDLRGLLREYDEIGDAIKELKRIQDKLRKSMHKELLDHGADLDVRTGEETVRKLRLVRPSPGLDTRRLTAERPEVRREYLTKERNPYLRIY